MEKKYNLIITEREFNNTSFKKLLIELINEKLKLNNYKPFYEMSNVEYELLKRKNGFTKVEEYMPKKKDRLKDEICKYNGKRCCLKGGIK